MRCSSKWVVDGRGPGGHAPAAAHFFFGISGCREIGMSADSAEGVRGVFLRFLFRLPTLRYEETDCRSSPRGSCTFADRLDPERSPRCRDEGPGGRFDS